MQLHYIHIENCPSMFRRLGALNITTREACGNAVRNVSADPMAGISPDEAFDVTPYAHALFEFLLGHPDAQDFGRKFKIALSGDKAGASGLVNIHDLGLIATIRDGKRGFEYYVGGGLGAVPYDAKLFNEFVPEEEILPLTQAVCRVYARLGEKKKRHRARIKFLVADMGIDKFREAVLEERSKLPADPRWTEFLKNPDRFEEKPLRPAGKGEARFAPTGDAAERGLVSVASVKDEGGGEPCASADRGNPHSLTRDNANAMVRPSLASSRHDRPLAPTWIPKSGVSAAARP
jgi:sulfite reductase (ferredoxin)